MTSPKTPLRLEDIEEFELVRRVPRRAINENPAILQRVRQLGEAEEIEPFLRQILADETRTAHTSTEIADILTHHVTRGGRPVLAAFVNKGRATRRVSAREVAHQISRLGRIPGIGLLVLLAVGDIQDDAKLDLLQTADYAGADYLIVDATDVARLFVAYHKVCPRDGTPYSGGGCPACGTPASEPVELTLRVHEDLRYDVVDQRDSSVGGVKRYTARIVTDPHYPKAVLRKVFARVTWDLRRSRFYRSELGEAAFGDRDADCVILFIYLGQRDLQDNNWVCRTLWCRPDLPADLRPLIEGEERLGEIVVDWSTDYDHLREFWSGHSTTKEAWVAAVEPLAAEADAIAARLGALLVEHGDGRLGAGDLNRSVGAMEQRARELLDTAAERGTPPVDCRDCDSGSE